MEEISEHTEDFKDVLLILNAVYRMDWTAEPIRDASTQIVAVLSSKICE